MISQVVIFLLFNCLVFTFYNTERKTADNYTDKCNCKTVDHLDRISFNNCLKNCQQLNETISFTMNCNQPRCINEINLTPPQLQTFPFPYYKLETVEYFQDENDLANESVVFIYSLIRNFEALKHYRCIIYRDHPDYSQQTIDTLQNAVGDSIQDRTKIQTLHFEFGFTIQQQINITKLVNCQSCDLYLDFNYVKFMAEDYSDFERQFDQLDNIENLSLFIRNHGQLSHDKKVKYHVGLKNLFDYRQKSENIHEKLYQSVTLIFNHMLEEQLKETLNQLKTIKLTLLFLQHNKQLFFTNEFRLNSILNQDSLKSLEIQASDVAGVDYQFIDSILFHHSNLQELKLKFHQNEIPALRLYGDEFNQLKVLKLDFSDNQIEEITFGELFQNKVDQLEELYIDISNNPLNKFYYSREIFKGLKVKKLTLLFQNIGLTQFNIFSFLQNFDEIEDLIFKISGSYSIDIIHSTAVEKTFPTIVNSASFEFNDGDVTGIYILMEQLSKQKVSDVTIILGGFINEFDFSTDTQVPYFTSLSSFEMKPAYGQNLRDQICENPNCLVCDDNRIDICYVCRLDSYLERDNQCYLTKTPEQVQNCGIMGQELREKFFSINTELERQIVDDKAIYDIVLTFDNESYIVDPDGECNVLEQLFLSNSTGLAIPFERSGHVMNFTLFEKDIIDNKYCSNSYEDGKILYICQFIHDVQMIQKRMVRHYIKFILEFDQYMTFQLSGVENLYSQTTKNNDDALKKLQALYKLKVCVNYEVPFSCVSLDNDEGIMLEKSQTFDIVLQMSAPLDLYNVTLLQIYHTDGTWDYPVKFEIPALYTKPGETANRITPFTSQENNDGQLYKIKYIIKKPVTNRLLQEQDEFEDQTVSLSMKIQFEDKIEKSASVSKSNDELSDEIILIIVLSCVFLLLVVVLVVFLKFRSLKNKSQKSQEMKYKKQDQPLQTESDILNTETSQKRQI